MFTGLNVAYPASCARRVAVNARPEAPWCAAIKRIIAGEGFLTRLNAQTNSSLEILSILPDYQLKA
jgi:hypothetical protein